MALTLNSAALSHARRLISEGKIDHGPWDGQSAPRNAETCLAHDESKKGTADEWKFPVIADGHVNAKGVASAAGYANAEGAEAIASVAHRLSNEIHGKMHGHMAMSVDPVILHAPRLAAGKAIPMALAGHPATINGQPAHYVRKEVARVGSYTHRGDGSAIDITPARADKWVDAFNKRLANGFKPFVPGQHRATFNATDNHGYVVDLKREGESLYATMQLIGDNALELAAKNDVSIYVIPDALDAKGNKYDEAIEHIALTPNPALPDLQPFVKIAASADAPARDVPVYELSATTPAPSRKDSLMTPELAKQFREKLGIAADVPDDKLPDLAAQKALSLSADVAKLTTERDAAKAEAKTKGDQVLALSADNKEPDALSLSLISRAFKNEREQVIASGVISQAGMDELDKLMLVSGKPTRTALSLSADSQDPLYIRICDIIKRFPGIKTNNGIPRGAEPATPTLAASADGKQEEKPPTLARMNELRANNHLEPWTKEQYEARLAGVK